MRLNTKTGEVLNYSRSPGSYDELEGVYPDVRPTLVESNRAASKGMNLNLWKLKLDTSGTWERITYFNEYGKFKATNPVISDDGKFVAFMVARVREVAGIGHGI